MTPRDQIQEHAKTAAAKIREAMNEFAKATGMSARVDIDWGRGAWLESATPSNFVTNVRVRIDDEAMG
ncbi:hypothetical protein [Delftia tsuruhatensis]|uniref:hypothetical protein n=1 Tax=Delftia tsuruhatensis TaxID=180282 RepID=UPI002260D7F8|nr:hypothetical protein [Delftia tsuruhatensis]MCX7509430.1 hypothetical protein [Delftia tsuruhatensis]